MKIGSLGSIVFEVSDRVARTFTEMNWDSKASYATHERHMKKGLLELTGFDPDEVSFTLSLSAHLGTDPSDTLKTLETMKDKGEVVLLVLGTTVIGSHWVVEQLSRKFNHIYRDGALVSCDVTVSLKEYVTR